MIMKYLFKKACILRLWDLIKCLQQSLLLLDTPSLNVYFLYFQWQCLLHKMLDAVASRINLNRNTHAVALFPLPSYKKVLENILCFWLQAPNTDCKDPGSEVVKDPAWTTPRSKGTARKDHKKAPSSHDFASRQHEGFCKSRPEPFFGTRIGVIANCNEP